MAIRYAKKLATATCCVFWDYTIRRQRRPLKITPTGDVYGPYQYFWEKRNNANDYSVTDLEQGLTLCGLTTDDYAFVSSYLFVQKLFNPEHINEVLGTLARTDANIILDIARRSPRKGCSERLQGGSR